MYTLYVYDGNDFLVKKLVILPKNGDLKTFFVFYCTIGRQMFVLHDLLTFQNII